jgi:hypothetical protein
LRLLASDGCQRAERHQHFAVASEHYDSAPGLGKSETQSRHSCSAHGTPKIEVERGISGGCYIERRAPEAGDHERIAAFAQEPGDYLASL